MPELPDVELYIAKLKEMVLGQPLVSAKMVSMFVLRTVSPPLSDLAGKEVTCVFRLGKRIVLSFAPSPAPPPDPGRTNIDRSPGEGFPDDGPFLVVHLMIAGRFLWRAPGAKPPGKITMAIFEFPNGQLVLTEASSKKRASIHVIADRAGLAEMDPGGIEPLTCTPQQFVEALRRENRTLKRGLTNPKTFSGIGNAFSDEILWAAKLSPVRLTQALSDEEALRLHKATVDTLTTWTTTLREEFKNKFPGPGDVTAFRPDYAVHGKFGKPCPVCGRKVQRITYAENETNYCAQCQNEGRMLADRSLSRLLKSDWPKTIEEMES